MATTEEQDTLRLLVQHVARGFYEPKYSIIMDQLARHPVLKDDDLAGRMGWQPKELNKVIAVLANDCLVKIYRQNELKEGAQRAVSKQYYYIDYTYFCNVVKWRIAKMRHKIDSNLRNELDNKGYICPQCKATYTPLDVDKLMDFARGCFVCEICQCEVVDNENPETVQGGKDRMSRFNHQMRFIRVGLQKSEAMVLPPFDVAAWVKANLAGGDDKNSDSPGAGLKIAGSDPNRPEDEGVGVVIASDKDEATRKMERDAQAELKRQQNALPSWHLKSTISGDLTALGIKESARAEAAVVNGVGSTSNDEVLRGLGVVGMKPSQSTTALVVETKRESKPVTNPDADYYEQYYASLAASAVASAQATPSGSVPGSLDLDDFGEDEEDRKPSLEYLNSLNDYRKRSRSQENEGFSGRNKIAKTESFTNGEHVNVEIGIQGEAIPKADPMVYVNGNPVAFSKVTEEDHELMTPEEYTAYFEVMQSLEE
ncbi:TFIIE alpha subunit-domain-containing protein [Lentinula edodes]|uniref:TFIIE alpha subunit-domain-containing protein n=1 Tax=Lentinula edodes TaxID=5353 RepID=UPI001E8EA95B|nr:TFIIE alpha subunit-domain-containing protein [Lentinula edodes]KAH7878639.1 TFIIE alpha subunit-domain-containing protein [Lentinula edodes]